MADDPLSLYEKPDPATLKKKQKFSTSKNSTLQPPSLASLYHNNKNNNNNTNNNNNNNPSSSPEILPATPNPSPNVNPNELNPPSSSRKSLFESTSIGDKMNEIADEGLRVLRGDSIPDKNKSVADPMLETLNYDSLLDYQDEVINEQSITKSKFSFFMDIAASFFITLLIAFATAMCMYLVRNVVDWCFKQRVDTTLDLITEGYPAGAYFTMIFASMAMTGLAALLCVLFAPSAKGSGVPYVFAYLNGTNIVNFFKWRVVLTKVFTLALTVASGLTLGREGPFVFIGGGVAYIVCHMLDVLPLSIRRTNLFKSIRNIREERIFITCGIAAGLSVAFSAPIAGVLFAMEGATAYLTVPTVLRIFGCSMFAMLFSDISYSGFSTGIKNHNLILIATDNFPLYNWLLPEAAAFLLIAVMGGMLGAFATWLNIKITHWRHHHLEGKNFLSIIEVLVVTFVTSTIVFVLPYVFGCRTASSISQCTPTPQIENPCLQVQCPTGMYNEIGSVVYSSSDQIAAMLMNRSLLPEQEFNILPLLLYGSCYLVLVAAAYGMMVPGGLFVPAIVVGAVYGRIVGIVIQSLISSSVNPGVYSLLGAAAMLGGFTRLALPVSVMLVEMTGDATYLVPIMFCSIVGKSVSDQIERPLYPQHMEIEKIPNLTDILKPAIAKLTAGDIMNADCASLHQYEKMGTILDVLDSSKSIIFPVIDSSGHYLGTITRQSVIFALEKTPVYANTEEAQNDINLSSRSMRQAETDKMFAKRNWTDTTDATTTLRAFDESMYSYLFNLTPYIDTGALRCQVSTPTKRVAALFRRLGLTHLGVIDNQHYLQGIITRRHLLTPPGQSNQPVEPSAHDEDHGHSAIELEPNDDRKKGTIMSRLHAHILENEVR